MGKKTADGHQQRRLPATGWTGHTMALARVRIQSDPPEDPLLPIFIAIGELLQTQGGCRHL